MSCEAKRCICWIAKSTNGAVGRIMGRLH